MTPCELRGVPPLHPPNEGLSQFGALNRATVIAASAAPTNISGYPPLTILNATASAVRMPSMPADMMPPA